MNERAFEKLKEKNAALSRRDQEMRPLACRAMPVKITINNTHKCNLTCPHCFKQFEPGNNMSYTDMPIDVFRAVAEDAFPYVDEVALSVSGEPLISPTIEEELSLGGKFGVHYLITTNGVPLGVPHLRDLVLRHVHVVHLSMDAGCKETFERIRDGARWEQVIRALEDLLREREERGYGPKIFANFVMMRENIEALPRWVALMSEIGVDGCFSEHVVVREACAVQSLVHHKRLAVEKMDEAKRVAESFGMILHLPPPYPLSPVDERKQTMTREEARERVTGTDVESDTPSDIPESAEPPAGCLPQSQAYLPSPEEFRAWNSRILPGVPVCCPYVWRETWIHHQGAVFCCDTNNFPHPMGMVPKERITQLWNCEKYRQLRQRLLNGEVYAGCRHCHVMGQRDNPNDPHSFVKGIWGGAPGRDA